VGSDGKLAAKYNSAIIRKLEKQAGLTDILQKHEALIEEFSEHPLVAGKRVALLPDGNSAFAAMFRAISNARDHINLETFIFPDGRITSANHFDIYMGAKRFDQPNNSS
jgi:cardiolipin synthase